jgi:hypothetical protein
MIEIGSHVNKNTVCAILSLQQPVNKLEPHGLVFRSECKTVIRDTLSGTMLELSSSLMMNPYVRLNCM